MSLEALFVVLIALLDVVPSAVVDNLKHCLFQEIVNFGHGFDFTFHSLEKYRRRIHYFIARYSDVINGWYTTEVTLCLKMLFDHLLDHEHPVLLLP